VAMPWSAPGYAWRWALSCSRDFFFGRPTLLAPTRAV
jgi:hypothetical protein